MKRKEVVAAFRKPKGIVKNSNTANGVVTLPKFWVYRPEWQVSDGKLKLGLVWRRSYNHTEMKRNPVYVEFGNDQVWSWHSVVDSPQSDANLQRASEPYEKGKPMEWTRGV